jgi:GxxExxY protein
MCRNHCDFDKNIAADKKDTETYAIIGAAMTVHRKLGHGFLEQVYQEALAIEMKRLNIPFDMECFVPVFYCGQKLNASYRADYICYGTTLVELKALASMGGNEEAQTINYLKATGLRKALLLNFGKPSLEFRRFIQSDVKLGNSAQSADKKDGQ